MSLSQERREKGEIFSWTLYLYSPELVTYQQRFSDHDEDRQGYTQGGLVV